MNGVLSRLVLVVVVVTPMPLLDMVVVTVLVRVTTLVLYRCNNATLLLLLLAGSGLTRSMISMSSSALPPAVMSVPLLVLPIPTLLGAWSTVAALSSPAGMPSFLAVADFAA